MIDLDLTGRRAVVTGASLGIGEATVMTLAAPRTLAAVPLSSVAAVMTLAPPNPRCGLSPRRIARCRRVEAIHVLETLTN